MKRVVIVLLAVAVFVAGCGGGGGGGSALLGTVIGRILDVSTGGPANPQATVQVGSRTTQSSPADGSFVLEAPEGTSSILVDTNSASGVWTFAIPTLSGTVDAGDLWIGPQRITVQGRVLDSSTGLPVNNAEVNFAGRSNVTDAQGNFTLAEVAYSNATQTAFWGIVGSVRATSYFKQDFTAAGLVAVSGVLNLGDVLITPLSDDDPPILPFNISGRVLPTGQALGTVVTLLDNGGTPVRVFNVGSGGTYNFWVVPGAYTVTFQNGALTAPSQPVTVTDVDKVVQVPDATLG